MIPMSRFLSTAAWTFFEYVGVMQRLSWTCLGSDTLLRRIDPVVQKYNVRYVLFPPGNSTNSLLAGSGLIYLLEQDPRWKVLYQDKVCVLMEKQGSAIAVRRN